MKPYFPVEITLRILPVIVSYFSYDGCAAGCGNRAMPILLILSAGSRGLSPESVALRASLAAMSRSSFLNPDLDPLIKYVSDNQ